MAETKEMLISGKSVGNVCNEQYWNVRRALIMEESPDMSLKASEEQFSDYLGVILCICKL